MLVTKVFYSLNAQDLPEFFEDNMETWMNAFHELLIKDVPCLHTGEDEEAGILEQLRSQICYNLGLYAQKYDEEFGKYMQQFVTDVWELLVKTGIQTKYDAVSNLMQPQLMMTHQVTRHVFICFPLASACFECTAIFVNCSRS